MGGSKESGSGDWVKLGTSIAGAVGGTILGGPAGGVAGWQLGSMGGDLVSGATGMQETGGGAAGTTQGVGNMGASAMSMTGAASGAADASKGFSGITSYGDTAKDVGGTNAWGQALGAGKGNPTVPTEDGFGKLGEMLTKGMDTAGAILKPQEEATASQGNLQPMTMTPPPQMAAPMNLSSVIAAQLMNPAAQNRLAYMHQGRM